MKKKLFIALLICIATIGLTGCNSTSTKKDGNKKSTKGTTISIKDNSAYFVKISGKKFNAGEKISTISKAKLKQKDSDLDLTIPSNRYLSAYTVVNSSNQEVCEFIPLNVSDKTITVKDAVIGGFEVGENNYSKIKEETLALNIEVVGGIKLGSTYDDIKNVLGKEDFKHETAADPTFNMPAFTTYKYSYGYKGYEFIVDDSGKVSQIHWNNYDFDE
ncbi:MAG: hypothetical protein E7160_04575 [Firmicutes bacterium]|nr:hypothetical protein [Bacillota bacterium]